MKSINKMTFEELFEEYKRCVLISSISDDDYGNSRIVMKSNQAANKLWGIAEVIDSKFRDRINDFAILLDEETNRINSWAAHCILSRMDYPQELESRALAVIIKISMEDTLEGLGNRAWLEDWKQGKIIKRHNQRTEINSQNDTKVETDKIDPSLIEKACALCLSYYNEMCSGGHSGWFDCYPEVDANELIEALKLIGAYVFADNFIDAKMNGINDGYIKTDKRFDEIKPSLEDIIDEFYTKHIPL